LSYEKNNSCIPTWSEVWESILEGSGSQSVLHGSQAIRDQLPGDPWIHFCNGYLEVYLLFNQRNNVLWKIIVVLLQLAMCLFLTTFNILRTKLYWSLLQTQFFTVQ